MWVDNKFIVASKVSHVQSRGKGGSKGCVIVMDNGHVIYTKFPMTQVVATLDLPPAPRLR